MPPSPKAAPKPLTNENFIRMLRSSKPTELPLGALSIPVRIVKKAGPTSPKKTASKRKNRRVSRKARKAARKTRRCGCNM